MNTKSANHIRPASSLPPPAQSLTHVACLAFAIGLVASLAVMAIALPHYLDHGDVRSWLSFGLACGTATVCGLHVLQGVRGPEETSENEPR